MKLRDRIRKTIKWAALALTAALMVCWIGGNWYHAALAGPGGSWQVGCSAGSIWIIQIPPSNVQSEVYINRRPGWMQFRWLFFSNPVAAASGMGRMFGMPLWAPLLVTSGIALAVWQLESAAARRARTGHCTKCNYSRAGLKPDASCPECGTVTTTA